MGILAQIISILILGLIAGASPGPILTSAFTEAFGKGFIKSLRVIFYAIAAETIVALFILIIIFSVNIPEAFFYTISFVGAVVLIWIASQVWRIKQISDNEEIFSFKKIFVLTIFNGPFWIFWITICVPQAFLLKERIPGGQFLFLVLFEFGWLAATLSMTFLFSRFREVLLRRNLTPFVFKFFATLLFLFAVKIVFQSGSFLLGKF